MTKRLRISDEYRFVRAFALAVDPGDTLGLLIEIGALGNPDPSASLRTSVSIVRRTREALIPAYDRANDLKDWEQAHTESSGIRPGPSQPERTKTIVVLSSPSTTFSAVFLPRPSPPQYTRESKRLQAVQKDEEHGHGSQPDPMAICCSAGCGTTSPASSVPGNGHLGLRSTSSGCCPPRSRPSHTSKPAGDCMRYFLPPLCCPPRRYCSVVSGSWPLGPVPSTRRGGSSTSVTNITVSITMQTRLAKRGAWKPKAS